MGDFRSFQQDRGSRSSGRSFGGRDGGRSFGGGRGFGGRGRDSGSRDRRDMPMCDAVCAKCGQNCQVPFKPTGDKPVYCSKCFEGQRDNDFGGSRSFSSTSSPISAEQFQQLNRKLDQVLEILNSLEMVDDTEDSDEEKPKKEEAEEEMEDDTEEDSEKVGEF